MNSYDIYEPNVDKLVVGARVRFRMGERANEGCPNCGVTRLDSVVPRLIESTEILKVWPKDLTRVRCPDCEFIWDEPSGSSFRFAIACNIETKTGMITDWIIAAATELTLIEVEQS